MPTSLVGLVAFVAFVCPGLAFVSVRERRRPRPDQSVFRETAAVGFISALCNAVVVAGFLIVSVLNPRWTPSVTTWITDGSEYVSAHFVSLGFWILGLFVASCLLGVLAAFVPGTDGAIASHSAWWRIFERKKPKGDYAFVGCLLTDGSYLDGFLESFNSSVEEDGARELVLQRPVRYREAGADDEPVDLQVDALTVSASQLRFVTTTWLGKEAATSAGGSGAEDRSPTAKSPGGSHRAKPTRSAGAAGTKKSKR